MMENTNPILLDVLSNDILYLVEENENAELEYVLDENGQKQKIGTFADIVNWEEKTIKDGSFASFFSGTSPKSINYNEEFEGFEFHQGKTYFGEVYLTTSPTYTTELTTTSIKNDILISMRAPAGVVNINLKDNKLCIGRGLGAIRVHKNYSYKYIFYFLKNSNIGGKMGMGYTSITKNDVENISVKFPKLIDPYSSYQLQLSIVKNLEEKFNDIDRRLSLIDKMKKVNDFRKEKILEATFENLKQPDSILCLVEESENGKLEYVLNKDGAKQEVCLIGQIKWDKAKLYKPIYEYNISSSGEFTYKLDKNGFKKKITAKSKLQNLNYIASKRMGFTIDENNNADDPVEWLTIDDLNKIDGSSIDNINTKDKLSQSDVFTKYGKSEKKIPIAKNDILVSFKMTIGVTKIFKSNQTAYCNEAIDIVTIGDRQKYSNRYVSLVIGSAYQKNVQQNVGSTTLNDDLKDLIFLQVPKKLNQYSSHQLQLSIVKNLEEKNEAIDAQNQNLYNIKLILEFLKEKILTKTFGE